MYLFITILVNHTSFIYIYIEELDGKEITEFSRQFLINWKATKDARKKITDGRIMTGQITYPFSGMDAFFNPL